MDLEDIYVLRSPPEERSERDIKRILRNLQLIATFCSFPLEIQRKIVKYGHHNILHERRIIIREGHVPEFAYFVLSGDGRSI